MSDLVKLMGKTVVDGNIRKDGIELILKDSKEELMLEIRTDIAPGQLRTPVRVVEIRIGGNIVFRA